MVPLQAVLDFVFVRLEPTSLGRGDPCDSWMPVSLNDRALCQLMSTGLTAAAMADALPAPDETPEDEDE